MLVVSQMLYHHTGTVCCDGRSDMFKLEGEIGEREVGELSLESNEGSFK